MKFQFLVAILLVPIVVFSQSTFLTPIATIQERLKYSNGLETTRTKATFYCTEDINSGVLATENDQLLAVNCIPPEYNYRLVEVARIPQEAVLVPIKSCLTRNSQAFQNATNQIRSREYLDALKSVSTSNPGRRLLEKSGTWDTDSPDWKKDRCLMILNTAYTLSRSESWLQVGSQQLTLEQAVQAALGRFGYSLHSDEQEKFVTSKWSFANCGLQVHAILYGRDGIFTTNGASVSSDSLGVDVDSLNTTLRTMRADLDVNIALVQNLTILTEGQGDQLDKLADASASIIDGLKNTTEYSFALKEIIDEMIDHGNNETAATKLAFITLQNLTRDAFGRVDNDLLNISNSIIDWVARLSKDIGSTNRYMFDNSISNTQTLQDLQSTVQDGLQHRQMKRLWTASYFAQMERYDTGSYFPFVSDPGVKPVGLTPAEERFLFDTIDMSFVEVKTGPDATRRVNQKYSFWTNTRFAIQQNRPYTRIDLLLLQLESASNRCRRSFIDPTKTLLTPEVVNATAPLCEMWVEVVETECTVTTATNPTFTWEGKSDTNLNQNDDEATGTCRRAVGTSLILTPKHYLFKSLGELLSFVDTSACSRSIQNNHMLFSGLRSGVSGYLRFDNSQCSSTFSKMRQEFALDNSKIAPFIHIMNFLVLGQPAVQIDIAKRDEKLYGRIPSDIEFNIDYFPHNPTGTSVNAEAHECWTGHVVVVHKNTIPVYNLIEHEKFTVTKAVTIAVTSQPTCIVSNNCYNVEPFCVLPSGTCQLQTVKHDVQLTDNTASRPSNEIIIGDIQNAMVTGVGLYDVAKDLSVSSNSLDRAYSVTYLLNPPGTLETISLPEWKKYNRNPYNPMHAGVSASDFKYEVLNENGSPVCKIPGAVPDSLIQSANRFTCASANYQWMNVSTDIGSLVYPSYHNGDFSCPTTSNSGVVFHYIYEKLTVGSPRPNTLKTATVLNTKGYTVMFWYANKNGTFTGKESVMRIGPSVTVKIQTGYPIIEFNESPLNSITPSLLTFDWLIPHHYALKIHSSTMRIYIDGLFWRQVTLASAGAGSLNGNVQFLQVNTTSYNSQLTHAMFVADSQTLLDTEIYRTYLCSQVLHNLRCSAGPVQERVIIAYNPGNQCSVPSTVLFVSTRVSDLYKVTDGGPTSHNGMIPASQYASKFTNSSYSISFWFRSNHVDTVAVERLFQIENQLSVFKHLNKVYFAFQFSGGFATWYHIPAMYADSDPHFVVVKRMGTGSSFEIWLDAVYVDVVPTAIGQLASGAYSGSIPTQFLSDYVSMVKVYPSKLLTYTEITQELHCMYDGLFNSEQVWYRQNRIDYVPPIAMCTIRNGNTTHGYCRHPAMCGGACSVYSTINPTTGVFTPVSTMCNAGYSKPGCVDRCSRVDSTTGICLDNFDTPTAFQSGLTPGSNVCQMLKNYRISYDQIGVDKFAKLRPNIWSYLTTAYIPSGKLYTPVADAVCPTVSISPNNVGGLTVYLTNVASTLQSISVAWNSTNCLIPGCCETGRAIVLKGYEMKSVGIPGCDSVVTIEVSSNNNGNNLTVCRRLEEAVVRELVATANVSFSFIEAAVVSAVDEVELRFNLQQISMLDASFQTQIASAGASEADQEYVALLQQARDELAAIRNNPSFTPADFNNWVAGFTIPQDLQDRLREAKEGVQAAIVSAETALAQRDQIINETNARMNAVVVEYQEVVLTGVNQWGVEINEALHSGGSAVAGGLWNWFWNQTGGFGSFMRAAVQDIMTCIVFVTVAYGPYLMYKRYKAYQSIVATGGSVAKDALKTPTLELSRTKPGSYKEQIDDENDMDLDIDLPDEEPIQPNKTEHNYSTGRRHYESRRNNPFGYRSTTTTTGSHGRY